MIDDCQGPGEILEQIKQGLESAGLSEASHALDSAVTPRSAQILRRAVKPGGYVDFVFRTDFSTCGQLSGRLPMLEPATTKLPPVIAEIWPISFVASSPGPWSRGR